MLRVLSCQDAGVIEHMEEREKSRHVVVPYGEREFDLLGGWDGTFPLHVEWRKVSTDPVPFVRPALAELELTQDGVRWTKHGRRAREWQDPLSAYRGIAARSRVVPPRDHEELSGRVLHQLVLYHSGERSRSVVLYASFLEEGFQAKHKTYCKMLGLPRLIASSTGAEAVEVTPTTSPSGDVVLPVGAPPRRVRVILEGQTLRLRTKPFSFQVWDAFHALFFVLLVLSVPVVIWLLDGPLWPSGGWFSWIFGSMVFVFYVLVAVLIPVLLALDRLASVQELTVTRAGANYERSLFGRWPVDWVDVKAEDVVGVVVAEDCDPEHITVQIIGGDEVVHFGNGIRMSKREKQWVRDCVAAVLGK
jgi:hypothetical protein